VKNCYLLMPKIFYTYPIHFGIGNKMTVDEVNKMTVVEVKEFKECPHYKNWYLKKKVKHHKLVIPDDCNRCFDSDVGDKCKLIHKKDSVWARTAKEKRTEDGQLEPKLWEKYFE